jgi:hypothetical protein
VGQRELRGLPRRASSRKRGRVYACKELPLGRAVAEYQLLRQMEELPLPVVTPVGHVQVRTAEGEVGVSKTLLF